MLRRSSSYRAVNTLLITQINHLILIAACSQNRANHKTQRGRNVEFLNVKNCFTKRNNCTLLD